MCLLALAFVCGCSHTAKQPDAQDAEVYGLELNPGQDTAPDSPASAVGDPEGATGETQSPGLSEAPDATALSGSTAAEKETTPEAPPKPAPNPPATSQSVNHSFESSWGIHPNDQDLEPDDIPEEALEDAAADDDAPLEENDAPADSDESQTASGQFELKKMPPNKSVQTMLDEALGFCQAAQEFWQKGELENALEALDQAYSLILDIGFQDNPDLIQQKDDIRFLISKRILEIYASRNIVVQGNHNAIPLDMNKHVREELKLFTTGVEKKFFRQSLARSGRYRPYIVSKLKEAGLPEELSWLPLIESGYKVKALSKARALGLWQFIPSTGYKFGLKRDQYIDERIDPIKSTDAAIAYLKELHNIFGDWATVLAAYNCGEGRVLRVIRSQNINYLDNFWDLYERLPRETARYVPRFLATLHIMSDPAQYGLDTVVKQEPLKFETAEVTRQVQVTDIAKKIGVPAQELKELNPELRYNILPPDAYDLKVPPDTSDTLLSVIDDIPISHPPRPAYVYHRVRSGETLSGIASRYHTSVSRIMRANNLRSSHYIVAGKKLKIPQKGTVIVRATEPVKTAGSKYFVHVVRSGDSLWIIAKRYGTTTRRIQELNNLRTTTLQAGQRLKIPGYLNGGTSDKDLSTYLVRRGDSPYRIARRHSMSLGELLRLNGLTPRSKIYPGQELRVR